MERDHDRPTPPLITRRAVAAIVVSLALLGGCASPSPTPRPSEAAVAPTASPPATIAPSPGATPLPYPSRFPLAVVTGLTNLKAWTSLDELAKLASAGKLVPPCGIEVLAPVWTITATCRPADQIAAAIARDPSLVALLPPGLVEPATKTLPVGGDGPFGLGGADLFGDQAARDQAYPILGRATDEAAIPVAWLAYDPSQVWTMASVGGVCSDTMAAYQALARHRGWAWTLDGGTARIRGKPHLKTTPGIGTYPVVSPIDTGHHGAVARLLRGADLTIADVECPIVGDFVPNYTAEVLRFTISAAIVPLWRDKLGFDLVYMAANHNTDRGLAGVKETLKLLSKYGIENTGLGLNLDEALEPAYVDIGGVRVAFVAWNVVPGARRANADGYGVAWLTKANVLEGVRRARAGGAQVVICDPQWWGGTEYHSDFKPGQLEELAWFDAAGCDQVVGAGTHLAGPMLLRPNPAGVAGATGVAGGLGLVVASEGNVTFNQPWWQQTQEGVFVTATFRGAQLVNVHLYSYVMLPDARPALTDPQGDGHYVLERVYRNSEVDYLR